MNTISVNHAATVEKTETGDLKKNDLLNCVIDREREREIEERNLGQSTTLCSILTLGCWMRDAEKKDVRSVKEAADVERRGEREERKRERTEATARSRK